MGGQTIRQQRTTGIGQLSLVEHALCPLDSRSSLVDNLVFDTGYHFSNQAAKRKLATAKVFSPLGLSAADELYLWGLLALTMLQPESDGELRATPHWCLRQLGVINQGTKRGGRQYRQFADAVKRLSAITYLNDAFYDPVREEHRRVSFGFFSYSLPVDLESSRAWRFVWDPIFYEMVVAAAGHFRFDLAVYRELDNASRRLFLFLSKVLSRRKSLRALRLEHLAVDLLGFSSTLTVREMKAKVSRCLERLKELEVLDEAEVFRTRPGSYFVRLTRGKYFVNRTQKTFTPSPEDSPLWETLQAIGFEADVAARLIRNFPTRLLAEWADITQAASERYGFRFFKKSPMAFLVDSVSEAAKGNRTAPDWWQELKRRENQKHDLSNESKAVFARIRGELFGESADVGAGTSKDGLTSVRSLICSE